jgi:hypothetical protein
MVAVQFITVQLFTFLLLKKIHCFTSFPDNFTEGHYKALTWANKGMVFYGVHSGWWIIRELTLASLHSQHSKMKFTLKYEKIYKGLCKVLGGLSKRAHQKPTTQTSQHSGPVLEPGEAHPHHHWEDSWPQDGQYGLMLLGWASGILESVLGVPPKWLLSIHSLL